MSSLLYARAPKVTGCQQFLVVGAQLCMMLMNRFGVYGFFSLRQSLQSDWPEDGEVIVSSPGHLHPDLLFHHMKNYM
jgi:hypothetical protein